MMAAFLMAAALPVPGRSVAASAHGVAASSQPLAAQAAVQVLSRGGSAVDAAIAANAVTGVVEPMMNGIGGELFAIVYVAREDKLYGLNASGWAARGMKNVARKGPESVTVPGAVAGWGARDERLGKLPLASDLAPAIWYAEHGFPVMEVTAAMWEGKRAGEMVRNADLALSLQRVAERGRDGFYKGETAQAMVEGVPFMKLDDLGEFRPEWVEPLHVSYRGWTVY